MTRPVGEQSVVVLGASSGIGRATALRFARRGAAVTCAARSEPDLHSLVAEIEAAGGRAQAVPTDAVDAEAVQRLADRAEERYGRIDTWVNAAAVSVWGKVEDITSAEFDRVLRVNVLGHVHGAQAALPALRRAGGGVIVGISSVEGVRAVPLHAPYTASKMALRGFYDCLRMELAAEGSPVAVTTILPASIDTPFFEHARSKLGGHLPKPPPPVYSADVVAAAIVRAAQRPTREVPVGGSAIGFFLGQRLNPALTDAVMSMRGVQRAALESDHPDDGQDNLDAPMPGTGRVGGAFPPARVLQSSAFTALLGSAPRPGDLVGAVAARLRRPAA
jgi:NAD(P)-dependent dehydrogenase (short-subunit alcohol dehydrogenase family)